MCINRKVLKGSVPMSGDDFSWKKEGIRNHNSLGKIVGIPPETLRETKAPYGHDATLSNELEADVMIDQFKEKIRNVLSSELNKEKEQTD